MLIEVPNGEESEVRSLAIDMTVVDHIGGAQFDCHSHGRIFAVQRLVFC